MPFKLEFMQSPTWRYVCVVFALLLFWTDLITPAGYAHGGLYTILLMMVTLSGDVHFLRKMAALSITLTITAAILTPTGALLHTVLFNRTLSVLEIILFTGLCITARNYLAAMEKAQKQLETSISIIDEQRDMLNLATTREKKVQELLVKFKYSFQQFADCIPQIIWTATPDGNVDFFNEATALYRGKPVRHADAKGWLDFLHPDDADHCIFQWKKALQQGSNYSVEFRLRRRDGEYRWHLVEAHPLRDEKGTIYKWCGSAVDVHNGKEMAEQIRRQGQHLFDTLESITDAFVTMNHAWVFTYVNREAERLLKKSRMALLGQNVWMLFPQADNFKTHYEKALRDGSGSGIAFTEYYAPLDKWLDIRAYPTEDGLAVHFRDITETRRLQERLSQTQKLESLGQLTGGIAHDFNNLLTVILGNTELMQEALHGSATAKEQLLEMVESIEIAATRGADLTHRLLAFARRQPLEPKPTDMQQLLREMENLLRRALPENLSLTFHVRDELWKAQIDSAELENAVLNLCLNSRDAMPNGGILTIEAANIEFGPDEEENDLAAGEYVMIAVSDNGAGIPAEVLPHVFDPFFTTKGPGSGTGLGLSMVYGFVKQSQGHVKIYSETSHGTTVRMYLPRATTAGKEPAPGRPPTASRGTELILLVEDNDLVRQHSHNLLVELGYQVLLASEAREALELLHQYPAIQLLFTDIIMPGGMNGRELADAAQKLRPGLKVLFTSGYTENIIVQEGRLLSGLHLLSKPYQRRELAAKLREVLEEENGGVSPYA